MAVAADQMLGVHPKIDKVSENKLRRAAKRQGYELIKSRTRDPRGVDYGLYGLIDAAGKSVFEHRGNGSPCAASLADVERVLHLNIEGLFARNVTLP
jgi:hypothetical protein